MNLIINGKSYEVDADPDEPLVWVIRDHLGLTGTKYGCGIGVCGSCTVHIDGQPARSCITPVSQAEGHEITTIEGLAKSSEDGIEKLHPVQQAFMDSQVPQCSWCMSGQMMTAAAFLEENTNPSDEDIVTAMSANYCRCGCYVRIKQAITMAAQQMGDADNG